MNKIISNICEVYLNLEMVKENMMESLYVLKELLVERNINFNMQ